MNTKTKEIEVTGKNVYGQRTIFLEGNPNFVALEGIFVEQTMKNMSALYGAIITSDLYNSYSEGLAREKFFYSLKPSENLTILVHPVSNNTDVVGQNIEFRVYNTKMNEGYSKEQVTEQTKLILDIADKYLRNIYDTQGG